MAEDKRGLIERLLVERISLQGICRAVGVTLKWLLGFLVQCFEALPDHLHVQPVSCTRDVLIQRLEVEAAELASFVQKKANKQWVWIAMDAKTRQIIAFHVDDRSHTTSCRVRNIFRDTGPHIGLAYKRPRTAPPSADNTTTSQGGHFQNANSRKSTSPSAKSAGAWMALVHTG